MDIRPRPPGSHIGELPDMYKIPHLATSITAFVGRAPLGPVDEVLTCFSFGDFELHYGGLSLNCPMSYAVRDFFNQGGSQAVICRLYEPGPGSAQSGGEGPLLTVPTYLGDRDRKTGIYLLEKIPTFNLLCIPPDQRLLDTTPVAQQDLDNRIRRAAAAYCVERQAIFIADPPTIWESRLTQGNIAAIAPTDLGITGESAAYIQAEQNVAVYFPRVIAADPLLNNSRCLFPACGMIAGVIAAMDLSSGVWTSPAGIKAVLQGIVKLAVDISDAQNGELNKVGINCLRSFPVVGTVVWGARTLCLDGEYKYLAVRRLTLFMESSIYEMTQWTVSESNDASLWSRVCMSVNSYLAELAYQGAFYNYRVSCDASTMTRDDIEAGRLIILVQFAPVYPHEFIAFTVERTVKGAGKQD